MTDLPDEQIFHEILVGANSYELALEIEKYKKMLYKKSFNNKEKLNIY